MNRTMVNRLILVLLAITTAITLIINLPTGEQLAEYGGLSLLFALLTAFALYLGVVLSEGELSSAHVIGMLAMLALPVTSSGMITWGLALGAVFGGALLVTRTRHSHTYRRLAERTARSIVVITARVTLSFFVAGQFYQAVGGQRPLQRFTADDILPVASFTLLYSLVYFAIFLLETYSDGRSVPRLVRNSPAELLTVLLLPVPLAVLGAEVYNSLSIFSFSILVSSIALTIIAENAISRAQYRLRRQLDELRSLSVVSQVVNANLNLEALLNMVYVQVSHLLETDNFLVALYDRSGKTLTYPLVIREAQLVEVARLDDPIQGELLEAVLKGQNPLLISREPSARRQVQLPAGIQSWLGVPLLSGGRTLGAMVVTSYDLRRRFDPDDLRLLNIVAASASIAIENAQLYAQQTERVNRVVTLNQVLAVLNDTLLPDAVLDTVVSSASMLARASGVAIYLFGDDFQDALALVRSAGLSDPFVTAPPAPLLLNGHQRQSLAQMTPLVIGNVVDDPRTAALRALLQEEGIESLVELPLAASGLSLGVLALYSKTPSSFNDELVELLRTFATQAAQSIRNARLYAVTDETLEKRVGQLLALAAVGHELTATIDMNTICSVLLSHALDATSARAGVVVVRDETTGALRASAVSGCPDSSAAEVNESLVPNLYKNNLPVLSGALGKPWAHRPLLPAARSQLSVPIVRAGREFLGVILVEDVRANAFSEDDSQFVMQLANQALIAIDNAVLFERIAEARDRLQVILNTVHEAIVMLDSGGTMILANPRVDLLGLTAEQLVGRRLGDLLEDETLNLAERLGFSSDQDALKLVREVRAVESWQGREPASYSVVRASDTLYIQRQVIPAVGLDEQIMGALLVFYDQTEAKALDQAREDLSHMILHDLRSPLTAVTTSLKLLTDLVPAESDFRPMVETTTTAARRAIRKLLGRLDSLLDVAKMQSGVLTLETRPTELATLVDGVCVELSPLAHELDVKVVSQIPENLPLLEIDSDKIERVLLNLLDNALKFSPSDSTVTIRAYQPGDGLSAVRVDVVDRGPGVPDDYKIRLFDRFTQLKNRTGSRRGTGLGLTFCRLVVEAHGGRVWIEDNPAGGSVFTFTLPLHTNGGSQT